MQAQSLPAPLDGWSGTATDRSAIVDLTQWMTESWNAGDGTAYGELFTEDCDYVAFDGTHLKGREQNARHHQALFETVLKGSQLVFEGEPQIRFLTPDIAVMHAMGSVLMQWQDRVTPDRRSKQTYVLVRGPEGCCWRITAFHNTRYRPLRLPSGLMLRLVLFVMRVRAAVSGAAPTKDRPKRETHGSGTGSVNRIIARAFVGPGLTWTTPREPCSE